MNWPATIISAVMQTAVCTAAIILLLRVVRRWPSAWRERLAVVGLLKFAMPLGVVWFWSPAGRMANLSAAESWRIAEVIASDPWRDVLFGWVHPLGGMLVFCWAAAQHVRLRQRLADGRADEAVQKRADELAGKLGIGRRVRVCVLSGCPTPAAVGLLRPVVVLPDYVAQSPVSAELDAVLLHELRHHQHLHLWWRLIALSTCAFWWWNPAAWIMASVLRRTQEERCDDEAVDGSGVAPYRYAEVVLSCAATGWAIPAGVAQIAGRPHPAVRRIARVLRGAPRTAVHPVVGSVVVFVAAVVFWPGATMSPAQAHAAPLVTRYVRRALPPDLPRPVLRQILSSITNR